MNVIYLGCNGFPFGYAEVQKQKMISKALINAGAKVTIINTKGILKRKDVSLPYKGNIEGINYFYTSFTAYRPNNYFNRNLLKIVGKIFEFFVIPLFKKRKRKNIAIISTRNIYTLFYYHLILRISGYKNILSYEEFVKNLNLENNKSGIQLKFDDLACKYCHGIMPISNFLEEYQKNIKPKIATFRIPALTDFNLIDSIEFNDEKERSILFCGASTYFENIKFIIDSFEKVRIQNIALKLIIHGNSVQNGRVFDYINQYSSKIKHIQILSDLIYSDLIKMYKKASLLLIPLKPYDRDIARFPHKISEYTASNTPILSTRVGEIKHYFTDNVNCFICENYDSEEYAQKIDFIFDNQELAHSVSKKAYDLGRNKFHYKSISNDFYDFLIEL